MIDVIKQWLSKNASAPGLLALTVQLPDKSALMQKCAAELSSEALENSWRCVLETIPVLRLNRFPMGRLRWIYQSAIVHCESRKDGICLGIFTSKDPNLFRAEELDRLVAEFHALAT